MKIVKLIFLSLIIVCLFTACSDNKQTSEVEENPVIEIDKVVTSEAAPEHVSVTFEIENYGKFVVETYPEYAPETVKHFLALVDSGMYDGFTVDSIVQSSAILSSETSMSASDAASASDVTTVCGEFTKNGRSNSMKLDKYTIALNHLPGEYDSGSMQFMIFLTSNHDMDGNYAGFAKVIEGTDVIDKIAGTEVDRFKKPVSPIVMKKVYINE